MSRFTSSDAISAFALNRPTGCVVVATMTAINHLFRLSPDPRNVCCVPLMGGAGALGLGVALARPDLKIVIFDGDGSLLMQLGGLASIAGAKPENLVHVVMNNGVWFENMANLPLPADCDFRAMAQAAGYPSTHCYDTCSDWSSALPSLLDLSGPTFVELKIVPARDALWSGDHPQPDLPQAQFTRMGHELRTLSQDLSR